MDWEMEMPNAADDAGGNVPVEHEETGSLEPGDYDLDIDTFSFGSDSEDDKEEPGATCTPELSTSFDIKLLQSVVEASAHALDIVAGKDVVMVAGKTGKVMQRIASSLAQTTHYLFHLLNDICFDRGG